MTIYNPGPRELADVSTPRVQDALAWFARVWGCDAVQDATHEESVLRAHGIARIVVFPVEDLDMIRDIPEYDGDDD